MQNSTLVGENRTAWLAACVSALVLVACGGPTLERESDANTVTYAHAGLGIAWQLPDGWTETHEAAARVYGGPVGGESYYTTVVLQSRAQTVPNLTEALETEFEAMAQRPHFYWVDRSAVWVAGQLALSYSVQFTVNDVRRFRTGVVFSQRDAVIDLSYNAPYPWAGAGLAAFAMALETLTVLPEPFLSAGVARHL